MRAGLSILSRFPPPVELEAACGTSGGRILAASGVAASGMDCVIVGGGMLACLLFTLFTLLAYLNYTLQTPNRSPEPSDFS